MMRASEINSSDVGARRSDSTQAEQSPNSDPLTPSDYLWTESPAGDVFREVIKALHVVEDAPKRSESHPCLLAPQDSGERVTSSNISRPGGFRRHFIAREGSRNVPPPFIERLMSLGVFQSNLLYTRFQLYDPEEAEGEGDDDKVDENDSSSDDADAGRLFQDRHYEEMYPHPPRVVVERQWAIEPRRLSVAEIMSVEDTAGDPGVCEGSDVSHAAAMSGGGRRRSRPYHGGGSFVSVDQSEERSKRATKRQTVMSLLKSFVGAGVLFLPRAFSNGGLGFSCFMMILTFVLNVYNMQRLVECCAPGRESYGEVAFAALGPIGRLAVDISIILSQLGFCGVYAVFISTNVQDLVLSMAGCDGGWKLALGTLILVQLPIYTPLSWVRRLKYFAPAILLADICIVGGLCTICWFVYGSITMNGISKELRGGINFEQWPLMLGTCVFLWEGIGLVLPVRSAMRDKDQSKFSQILVPTLTGILTVYLMFATLSYLAFGEMTSSVILLNLPNSGMVYVVQFMYITAVILTYPIQFFPAAKVVELRLFGPPHLSKVTLKRKWGKNLSRFCLVCGTLLAAHYGSEQLDNFVALIGAFCCLPLGMIYPCLFHIILSRRGKVLSSPRVDSSPSFLSLSIPASIVVPTSLYQSPPLAEGGISQSGARFGEQQHSATSCAPSQTPGAAGEALSRPLLTGESLPSPSSPSRWQLFDIGMVCVGVVAMIFTTRQAIISWHPQAVQTRCEAGLLSQSAAVM